MNTLPVGIQLYTLRDMLEETPSQFPTVMRRMRDYGYDGVELAGTYGLAPEFIRDTLDEIGLAPVCAHVPLDQMIENPLQTAKEYAAIGCRFIAAPYLPEQFRHFTPGYQTVLAELTRVGRVMQ
ncbi:MAG: hypothetical protein LBL26_04720 [Peptococcaceae bacterium]|nr:hypothetical protein [Peptococcaceae bacterium]